MTTSDRVRLTAAEMKELEGLTFRYVNDLPFSVEDARRYDELVNKEGRRRG